MPRRCPPRPSCWCVGVDRDEMMRLFQWAARLKAQRPPSLPAPFETAARRGAPAITMLRHALCTSVGSGALPIMLAARCSPDSSVASGVDRAFEIAVFLARTPRFPTLALAAQRLEVVSSDSFCLRSRRAR